jgi:hypothetical protein
MGNVAVFAGPGVWVCPSRVCTVFRETPPYKGFLSGRKDRGNMAEPRYWIVVASEEHVMLGVAGGFAQAGHGKRSGLARMHTGDRIVYYSPKKVYGGDETLHAFTAMGEVSDEEIVQVEMSPDFRPFRRNVKYLHSGEVRIEPLINDLEFIRNKKSWGYAFRFGLLEIHKPDFARIAGAFESRG